MHLPDNLTYFSNLLSLDDCWLLSAITSLAVHPSLLEKVVPVEQSFKDGYNGSFTFRVNTCMFMLQHRQKNVRLIFNWSYSVNRFRNLFLYSQELFVVSVTKNISYALCSSGSMVSGRR